MDICTNLISKKQACGDAITSGHWRKKRPTNPKTAGTGEFGMTDCPKQRPRLRAGVSMNGLSVRIT
jgi:hypothetical protein